MTGISDQLLSDIAARVAGRVAKAAPAERRGTGPYTLLALSGGGGELTGALDALASAGGRVVAVADCPTGTAGPMAEALARLRGLEALTGEAAYDADAAVAGAERVLAPAMDLALASRVASMQADTPASRAILRALLAGISVEATLDDRAFAVSRRAAEGARRALSDIVDRLGALGVRIDASSHVAAAPRAAAAASHPSRERFSFAEPVGEFVEFLQNVPCSIEPDKPCVGCGVCEARGF